MKTVETKKEMFAFLDRLRSSGKTNMMAAAPYLAKAFDIEKDEARVILYHWIEKKSTDK